MVAYHPGRPDRACSSEVSMRRVFLWAARNRWLKERLPRFRFMRRAVRRFMPGETLGDALAAALPLQAAGIGTMYTRLGENLEDLAAADEVAAHYIEAVDKIVAAGITGEISVKPTQLGLDLDADVCLAHLVRIAEHAGAAGSYTWVDMEGSAYTESTIALYEKLRAVQPRTGICLQAYLRRTAADFERLRPLDPAIRLVKGAYDEKASIAYTDRSGVDANYVGLAVRFLLDGRGRPIRLGLGTHDVALIEQIAEQVGPAGIGRDAFEIEMLYGIRSDEQFRLAKAGYRVQALIAYGEHWYPWYMRRLAERPANVWFALRQMLP
jgi:proline dehydrogenase